MRSLKIEELEAEPSSGRLRAEVERRLAKRDAKTKYEKSKTKHATRLRELLLRITADGV